MTLRKFIDAADARIVWAFGKPYQFHWVRIEDSANPGVQIQMVSQDFVGGDTAKRYQKSQIMLHSTGSNNMGLASLSKFRTDGKAGGAHIVLERTAAHTRGWPGIVPIRASRAAIALIRPDAVSDGTEEFIDVVLLADLNAAMNHGSYRNSRTIGIEHHNVIATGWGAAKDETLTGHGAAKRPADKNRFFEMSSANTNSVGWGGTLQFQAFEEEQYNSQILMLRQLCLEHRIPRKFFGTSWVNRLRVYLRWHQVGGKWRVNATPGTAARREDQSMIKNARGIVRHSNVHRNKTCPGIFHYNRMYRGLIDEWWMPVEITGAERGYYSGPHYLPPFKTVAVGGAGHQLPALFRWLTGPVRVESSTMAQADIEPLLETKSYFDEAKVNTYFSHCESLGGGTFPIGANKVWHGGIHLSPPESGPFVYAAASATVVAARVSSNPETDERAGFGSQRFVLLRHAVYWELEDDADGPPASGALPVAKRTKYTDPNPNWGPTYVFSLYMHLDDLADLFSEHAENPRWYNKWLRKQAAAQPLPADPDIIPPQDQLEPLVGMDDERGRVFNPDVEVSVGDVLGTAGQFAKLDDPATTQRLLHFEVLSHVDAPVVLDGSAVIEDLDQNRLCDVAVVNDLLNRHGGQTAEAARLAAPSLRNHRLRCLSTWSWSKHVLVDFLGDARADEIFTDVHRMTWMDDALAVNPDLATQLGDTGHVWHYHPVYFMQQINALIRADNREFAETEASQEYDDVPTNVEVDDDNFLTHYYSYNTATDTWTLAAADATVVRPFAGSDFKFTRRELACHDSAAVPPTAHLPANAPPEETRFAYALLEVLQRIRVRYNRSLTIEQAHICPAHVGEVRCPAGRSPEHQAGVAVDFHDTAGHTQALARRLWTEVGAICTAFNADVDLHGSTSCNGSLPPGYDGVEFHAQTAAVGAKLTAATALTAVELAGFRVHLSLRAVVP